MATRPPADPRHDTLSFERVFHRPPADVYGTNAALDHLVAWVDRGQHEPGDA